MKIYKYLFMGVREEIEQLIIEIRHRMTNTILAHAGEAVEEHIEVPVDTQNDVAVIHPAYIVGGVAFVIVAAIIVWKVLQKK